jgi:hypothetical protein
VAAGNIQAHHSLVWVLMITSADNRRSPSDVAVSDLATAGLPAASVVRTAKVAVIDACDAERLGTLPNRRPFRDCRQPWRTSARHHQFEWTSIKETLGGAGLSPSPSSKRMTG